ncbi:hypothetical protein VTK56DRAFT_7658 [Thermocarpiscus australiensis]
MDRLPLELVQLVFHHADPPTVRTLRLVSRAFADVGYEYLLQPHFNAVEWRDDVERLRCIAGHDRLRGRIKSVTFNFSKVDEYDARDTTFFRHRTQKLEERGAWIRHCELEESTRKIPPFHSRVAVVEESFKRLPNLKELDITLTACPYGIGRRRDRDRACKNMNAIVSAIRHVRLSSLSIDQLPLEIFRLADDRRHWFDCARSFASLSRLVLVLDPPSSLLPASRFRAINGLGHVLHFSPNLTHLTLAFHTYHAPTEKFSLSFRALFPGNDFTFKKLTDLKLEGICCAEEELRSFLRRHGHTLERLRLGGRGLAEPHELSIGGIHLHEGTFRSLFTSLQGKLPKLQRFHMEGDFEAGDFMTSSRTVLHFRAVTDDNWEPVAGPTTAATTTTEGSWPRFAATRPPACIRHVDSRGLERYLIYGGEYPTLVRETRQHPAIMEASLAHLGAVTA